MIGAVSGLGYLVLYSEETFNVPEMYAGIVGLAILGIGLNYLLHTAERFFTSWKDDVKVGE
jgi:NitT/TauT family transport system permease protein